MSCGQIALNRAGIHYDNYFASEVDKHAIKVTQHNYPSTVQLGDVTQVAAEQLPKIDLLIGGSPCQSISTLGKGEGLNGKSGLFFHYLRLLKSTNPKWFLLENVVGNKESLNVITELMGVDPVLINSASFSAQNRKRLYWTNIHILPYEDSSLTLQDVLDSEPANTCKLSEGRLRWLSEKGKRCLDKRYASIDPVKAACLTARSDASWNSNYVTRNGEVTKLTCEEYEKLQTVPAGYTACVTTAERYKMLGNGWTVDVVAHILKGIGYES